MEIFNNINTITKNKCVLALGNFDGVHTGHKLLIQRAKEIASKNGFLSGIYTFAVNSKLVLNAESLRLLTTDSEKNNIFSSLGIDFVCYDDFNLIKDISPEEFCDYLAHNTGVKVVVCGDNFTFGRFACANSSDLKSMMNKRGIGCEIVKCSKFDGLDVSSTVIRKLLADGDTDKAAALLGYRYFIEAEVVHGARLGHTLGFPTINQKLYGGKVVPAYGVYLCMCSFDGESHPGVVNVGVKPTVSTAESTDVVFETNILDFNGDLYGKTVKLEFYGMLRREQKFPSLDALKEAVLQNIKEARDYFGKDSKLQ